MKSENLFSFCIFPGKPNFCSQIKVTSGDGIRKFLYFSKLLKNLSLCPTHTHILYLSLSLSLSLSLPNKKFRITRYFFLSHLCFLTWTFLSEIFRSIIFSPINTLQDKMGMDEKVENAKAEFFMVIKAKSLRGGFEKAKWSVGWEGQNLQRGGWKAKLIYGH